MKTLVNEMLVGMLALALGVGCVGWRGAGNGPLLLVEFDFFLYRIPFLGPIGIGIAGGWAGYKGVACETGTITGVQKKDISKPRVNSRPARVRAALLANRPDIAISSHSTIARSTAPEERRRMV